MAGVPHQVSSVHAGACLQQQPHGVHVTARDGDEQGGVARLRAVGGHKSMRLIGRVERPQRVNKGHRAAATCRGALCLQPAKLHPFCTCVCTQVQCTYLRFSRVLVGATGQERAHPDDSALPAGCKQLRLVLSCRRGRPTGVSEGGGGRPGGWPRRGPRQGGGGEVHLPFVQQARRAIMWRRRKVGWALDAGVAGMPSSSCACAPPARSPHDLSRGAPLAPGRAPKPRHLPASGRHGSLW